MLQRWVDVEEDGQPVIEAGPPHAPLVDKRPCTRLGLPGRHAVVDELAVDHDLGRGALFDRVDGPLGRDLRLRREDAGEVVDGLAVDGVREWGTWRRDVGDGTRAWDTRGVVAPERLPEGRSEADDDRSIDVAGRQPPVHLVLDRGTLLGVHECLEAGARRDPDIDRTVRRHVGEEHHPGPVRSADVPLGEQRCCVGRRVRVGWLRRLESLGVDDDLGVPIGLDAVDDLFCIGPGVRREHVCGVVDGLVRDGVRERRAGGRHDGRQEQRRDAQ